MAPVARNGSSFPGGLGTGFIICCDLRGSRKLGSNANTFLRIYFLVNCSNQFLFFSFNGYGFSKEHGPRLRLFEDPERLEDVRRKALLDLCPPPVNEVGATDEELADKVLRKLRMLPRTKLWKELFPTVPERPPILRKAKQPTVLKKAVPENMIAYTDILASASKEMISQGYAFPAVISPEGMHHLWEQLKTAEVET